MTGLLTQWQGAALLIVYAASMLGLTLLLHHYAEGKEEFLVGRREIGMWPAAFSIAATWVWAPALFVAAQKAYQEGVAGVFWFTVPNALCLVLFAFFAERLRRRVPHGYTLPSFMGDRYSSRVQGAYLFQMVSLATCSFAVQLLAGGAAISLLTGMPFWFVTVALAATALSYSLWSGIRASVATDYAQMVIILLVALTIIPWAVYAAGGLEVIARGLGGVSGQYASVFNADVALAFGLPVTIGLLSGPFGDQSFWQRAWSVREKDVRRAFIWAAVIFALVPLTLCVPGFLAAGMGLAVASPQMVNLETILTLLPAWVAIPFAFMLLSGLISTLDSNLCAISGLAGHDAWEKTWVKGDPMIAARWAMVGLAVAGIAIANIPGLSILHLFLFYGTLRASTLLPTVMTILDMRLTERGVFWGIVFAIAVGLPIFAYGNFGGGLWWTVGGSLLTVLSSGAVAWLISRQDERAFVRVFQG